MDFSVKTEDGLGLDTVESKVLREEIGVVNSQDSCISMKDIGNIEEVGDDVKGDIGDDYNKRKEGASSSIFSYFNNLLGMYVYTRFGFFSP